MKKLFLTSLLLIIPSVCNANALWDLYAGVTGGVGGATIFMDHDHNSGSANSFGAVFGLDIPFIRAEIEYSYLTTDDNFNTNVGMLNAYVKPISAVFVPYIGLGVGVAAGGDLDGSATAYQGMVGLTLDLEILPLKFDIEGRAMYIPDFMEFADIKPDILQYEGRLKVRYIF